MAMGYYELSVLLLAYSTDLPVGVVKEKFDSSHTSQKVSDDNPDRRQIVRVTATLRGNIIDKDP